MYIMFILYKSFYSYIIFILNADKGFYTQKLPLFEYQFQ